MLFATGVGQHVPVGRGSYRQDAVPIRSRFDRVPTRPSCVSTIFGNQFPRTDTYIVDPPGSSSIYVSSPRKYSRVQGGGFGAILLTSLLVLGLLLLFPIFLI